MQIQTFASIAAPRARVWELLADFGGYDRWSPMMSRMRGRCAAGERVHFRVQIGAVRAPLSVEILVVEPGHELRWVGPGPRLARRAVSGEHYFILTDEGTGTRLEHGEVFRGALMPARWDRASGWLRPAYEAHNEALKQAAEA